MPVQRWATTVTGLSSTFGYPIYVADWDKLSPFNLGISAVLTTTSAAPSYNLETTLDFTGSSAFISTAASWFSSAVVSSGTASGFYVLTAPVTAIRPNVTAGSSIQTLVVTVISG
jgi:hypothetical protein